MKDEILAFIKHFQNDGTIKAFTNGCCYWFAQILKERFDGVIVYDPTDNHFATMIDGRIYDITGFLEIPGVFIEWREYQLTDPLESSRLYRDCILKLDRL